MLSEADVGGEKTFKKVDHHEKSSFCHPSKVTRRSISNRGRARNPKKTKKKGKYEPGQKNGI